jgi:hypothetical protein
MGDLPRFIVAEISRNWIEGASLRPGTLASDFEHVLTHNLERGYTLVSFQLHRVVVRAGEMNETIIAVFQRQGDE